MLIEGSKGLAKPRLFRPKGCQTPWACRNWQGLWAGRPGTWPQQPACNISWKITPLIIVSTCALETGPVIPGIYRCIPPRL